MKTDVRFRIETRKRPLRNRIKFWFSEVLMTLFSAPPREYNLYAPVNPGEPGYDDAPYEQVIILGDSKVRHR